MGLFDPQSWPDYQVLAREKEGSVSFSESEDSWVSIGVAFDHPHGFDVNIHLEAFSLDQEISLQELRFRRFGTDQKDPKESYV